MTFLVFMAFRIHATALLISDIGRLSTAALGHALRMNPGFRLPQPISRRGGWLLPATCAISARPMGFAITHRFR
jgi:hypothetical protein